VSVQQSAVAVWKDLKSLAISKSPRQQCPRVLSASRRAKMMYHLFQRTEQIWKRRWPPILSPALKQSPLSNSYFFVMAASFKSKAKPRAGTRHRMTADNLTATSISAPIAVTCGFLTCGLAGFQVDSSIRSTRLEVKNTTSPSCAPVAAR